MTLRSLTRKASLIALPALAVPGAILAQAVVIEPYSQGGANRDAYKEVSGSWSDVTETAPLPEVKAAGSRMLQQPTADAPATVEFAPATEPGRDIQVSLVYPGKANAKGLRLELAGDAEQAYPVIFTAEKANQWVTVGSFRVPEGQKPVFRLATTSQLSAAEEGRPVDVTLVAARFVPIDELPDDPFLAAAAQSGVAVQDPFATASELSAGTQDDPFRTATQAAAAAQPNAPSPFVTDQGTPVDQVSPFEGTVPQATPAPADPFMTGTTREASPFAAVPGTEATTSSPFESNAASSGLVESPFSTTAPSVAPADPFASATADDPFATSGESPFAASGTDDPFASTPPVNTAVATEPAAVADPFASTAPQVAPDPFGTGQGTAPDPFASTTAAPADPFASTPPADPFASAPGTRGNTAPNAAPSPFLGMSGTPTQESAAPATGQGTLPQPVHRGNQDRYLAADLVRAQNTGRPTEATPLFPTDQQQTANANTAQPTGSVTWTESLGAAQQEAMKRDRPILLVFMSENAESQLFAQNLLTDKSITDLIARSVAVQITYAGDEPLVAKYSVPRAPYGVVLNKHGFTQGHVRLNRSKERIAEDLQKLLK